MYIPTGDYIYVKRTGYNPKDCFIKVINVFISTDNTANIYGFFLDSSCSRDETSTYVLAMSNKNTLLEICKNEEFLDHIEMDISDMLIDETKRYRPISEEFEIVSLPKTITATSKIW